MSRVRIRNAGWLVLTLVGAVLVGAACAPSDEVPLVATSEKATAVESVTPSGTPSGEREGAGEAATESVPSDGEVISIAPGLTATEAGGKVEPDEAAPIDSAGGTPEGEPAPAMAFSGMDVYRELNPDGSKDANPRYYSQLLSRDAIRPIYSPIIASAEEADLDSRELVIGVSIEGETRAYPIRPLNRREMVNDVVGGVPILVTW